LDIKWKNIKYSSGLKLIAAIILWLSALCFVACGIAGLYYEEEITSSSYYETSDFKENFGRLTHNVVELNVELKNEKYIKTTSNDEYIIKDKLNRFYIINNRLPNVVNFKYYVKNTDSDEVFTNIEDESPIKIIKEQPVNVFLSSDEFNYKYLDGYINSIRSMVSNTPYEIYAAVEEPLQPGDIFYDSYYKYFTTKNLLPYGITVFIISFILLITAFIYLVNVIGKNEKNGEVKLVFIDKIYADIHTILILLAAMISGGIVNQFGYLYHSSMFIIIDFIIFSIDLILGLNYVFSIIRQIKNKSLVRNTLIYHIYKRIIPLIKMCFKGKMFKPWILVLLVLYQLFNIILFARDYSFFIMLLIIGFNICLLYFVSMALLSLTHIMEASKEISKGNLDYVLDTPQMSIVFWEFSENIQSIQEGMKNAVAKAIKGEQMKTTLITNVSHDLKTPLTSIISYIDLLKKEDLNNETAVKYINILEDKSTRLKQLIEDLIEASKASSGNLALNKESIDLHELISQSCGEYEEKIKESKLDFCIEPCKKVTTVSADGKHMWRIVENLLSNVLKYSLPNSRVYINIDKSDTHGILTIKNISKDSLNISPEQLTERFVRGDLSRTTEGSGLGLSIAQSLTTLQGGIFDIQIDGDLFKVIISMPLG
jgi:signal transduction histidine kinase